MKKPQLSNKKIICTFQFNVKSTQAWNHTFNQSQTYRMTDREDEEKPVSSNKIVNQVTSIAISKCCGGEIYLHVRKKTIANLFDCCR